MSALPVPSTTAGQAVEAVLASNPPAAVAARFGLAEDELARAVALYRTAGEAALLRLSEWPVWHQVTLTAPTHSPCHGLDPMMLARLGTELGRAEADAEIGGYHFLRKDGGLRLRVRPSNLLARRRLAIILDGLAAHGHLHSWAPGIYEPETYAFGGPAAMRTAHALFCADSRALLSGPDLASPLPVAGTREASVLLISTLLRATGLDAHEQGEVWARVAAHRDPPQLPPREQVKTALAEIAHLLNADAAAQRFGTAWRARVAAFAIAGRDLATLARTGALERGLRAVLARHALFAFNRAGVSGPRQAIVAHLAHAAAMNDDAPIPAHPADHSALPAVPTEGR
ncbi:thiopeptide-type bacteriocin biosynthesis protein [Nonomuraea sp. NPDC050547]|uniref:thiopeptide-type bacteriocin biosynthesis protein n=1 Tax=Nonomuraea sp. NPDC050547 TaxID=3364368 RepID=UPI0037928546